MFYNMDMGTGYWHTPMNKSHRKVNTAPTYRF